MAPDAEPVRAVVLRKHVFDDQLRVLEARGKPLEERPVRSRYGTDELALNVLVWRLGIRTNGRSTPKREEAVELPFERSPKGVVVVPFKEGTWQLVRKLQQDLDHFCGTRAAVYVVAEEDEQIRVPDENLEQSSEGAGVAMNVTDDRDFAHRMTLASAV
jgi:hypothetical protein